MGLDNEKATPGTVLVMGLIDPSGNPRPSRLIKFLKLHKYNVHVASFPFQSPLEVDGFYEISRPSKSLWMRIFRKIIRLVLCVLPFRSLEIALENLRWNCTHLLTQIGNRSFDAVFVEDLYLLPLAIEHFGGHKVIFDAREYYPEEFENNFIWRFVERPARIRTCRRYLNLCYHVLTVSEGLQTRYWNEFCVKTTVLRSTPSFTNFPVNPISDNKKIRLVHHGLAHRDRCLENIIDAYVNLDNRFELDFYLGGDESYKDELRQYIANLTGVRILDPVPYDQILPTLNKYDIGICYFEPTTFNLQHCLPNKFFEFIQARLALAVGPSPEMVPLISKYGCGVIATDFSSASLAEKIKALTDKEIMNMKEASDRAAQDLCYDNEGKKILDIIDKLQSHEEK